MNASTKQMWAVQCDEFGSPDVLVYRELPIPKPGAGQILVKVESAAINFADVLRRRNSSYPFPTALPYIPGSEVAGIVEALGDGVAGPPVGTSVFALVGNDGSTGYAQYALANAPQVIPLPPGLSKDIACGLVVAGATAVLILKESARIQAGESVLVQAAAGGVGSYAVQFAKLFGAGTVIGAASTKEKRDRALSLGADYAIDYTGPGWVSQLREITSGRGVDIVLEMSGGNVFEESLQCLAPFGRSVVYGSASSTPRHLSQQMLDMLFSNPALNQSLIAFNLGAFFGLRPAAAGSAVEILLGAVMAGQVKVQVGQVMPLRKAAEAHRLIEERRSSGKIVLKPWMED